MIVPVRHVAESESAWRGSGRSGCATVHGVLPRFGAAGTVRAGRRDPRCPASPTVHGVLPPALPSRRSGAVPVRRCGRTGWARPSSAAIAPNRWPPGGRRAGRSTRRSPRPGQGAASGPARADHALRRVRQSRSSGAAVAGGAGWAGSAWRHPFYADVRSMFLYSRCNALDTISCRLPKRRLGRHAAGAVRRRPAWVRPCRRGGRVDCFRPGDAGWRLVRTLHRVMGSDGRRTG